MVTTQQKDDLDRLLRLLNPNGEENDELIELLKNMFDSASGTEGTGVGSTSITRLGTDVIFNNTTTLGDAGLTTGSLPANTQYYVKTILNVSAANATPDLKIKFEGPTGAAFSWDEYETGSSTANTIASEDTIQVPVGTIFKTVSGLLKIGSTAGTLQLKAAQNTAHASDIKILAGSVLRLIKL